MGKLSDHKKTKFGMLPGDKPLSAKIAMVEGRPHPQDEDCAKAFKRDHAKKANRRMRRKPIEVPDDVG